MNFDAPVLLIVFNRPNETRYIFDRIREIKPIKLFVAGDGPRELSKEEDSECQLVRKIATSVTWNCDLKTLFHRSNLGCKIAVTSAINWFFENVKEGIILEDDCYPSRSFFIFCQELLYRFRNDERIGMISGNNRFNYKQNEYSYHFSKHGLIWGWATWKRAWEKYDVSAKLWNKIEIDKLLFDIFKDKKMIEFWQRKFALAFNGLIDTWDFQWSFTRYVNNYLTVRPRVNLVANLGFGEKATHTKGIPKKNYTSCEELVFPLKHPPFVVPDSISDRLLEKDWISSERLIKKIFWSLKRRISSEFRSSKRIQRR